MTLPKTEKMHNTSDKITISNSQLSSVLLDSEVRNNNNEKLGTLKSLVIDTESGKVNYLVIAFGGFLGVGESLSAIPWKALRYNNFKKNFTLDLEIKKLKTVPVFDKDNWPDFNDAQWVTRVEEYYINGFSH